MQSNSCRFFLFFFCASEHVPVCAALFLCSDDGRILRETKTGLEPLKVFLFCFFTSFDINLSTVKEVLA